LIAATTNNICIEHRSIGNSKSDFAVYHFKDTFWLIAMADLKGMIGKYPVKEGGDFNYKLTLVPEREFVRQAL
jgi:hypothetical protein